ncbi:MAG: PrsW family intramembrane metalloprotease, partial [Micromonosporaceae bacterium]
MPGPPAPADLFATPPPAKASHRRGWLRIVIIVGLVVAMSAGGLTIFWMVSSELGFGVFAAGAVIALLPVPFLATFFLWLDRFDPAPRRYLIFAFCWGAFVSTAISLGVNTFGSFLFERAQLPGWGVAVFVAPVVEETTKALALLLIFWFRRREIVGIADALVYAGLAATGFAMTENILYLGKVYVSGEQMGGAIAGVGGVIGLIIFRLGMTGFIHPLFTVMTGIGVGLAARSPRKGLRWLYPIAGLVVAMLLHGSWNLMATFLERSQQLNLLG